MAGFMTTTALNHTGLGIGFATSARLPKKNFSMKPALGSGPEARFELLPDQKSRAGAMGVSMSVQVCLVIFLVALPLFFPEKLVPKLNFNVMTLTAPLTQVPMPKPIPLKPKSQPVVVEQPKPLPTTQPKMIVPRVVAPKAPKVEKPVEALKLNNFEAPKVDASLVAPSAP